MAHVCIKQGYAFACLCILVFSRLPIVCLVCSVGVLDRCLTIYFVIPVATNLRFPARQQSHLLNSKFIHRRSLFKIHYMLRGSAAGALGGIQRYVAQTTDPTFFEVSNPGPVAMNGRDSTIGATGIRQVLRYTPNGSKLQFRLGK